MKSIWLLPHLFLGLCFSGAAGAQASVALLVTTDMSCNLKIDGQPMGLLQVGCFKVVPVSPGNHVIEAVAPDGVTIIRPEVKIEQGQKALDIQPKIESAPSPKMQQVEKPRGVGSTDATQTWTNPDTKLIWTKNDNGSDLHWNQASSFRRRTMAASSGRRPVVLANWSGSIDSDVDLCGTAGIA